jgi:hypothetical protein
MALINGTAGDNTLNGGNEDDTLLGRAGDDVLNGRSGDDVLRGGSGDDVLNGGSGDDILRGGSGDDVLNGGSGDDILRGGSGDDELNGGSGDDQLFGGSGDDELNGGSGDDVLRGGTGDDVLNGGSGDDELFGGAGDDVLNGGSGDDVLAGGAGDDILNTGSGDDTIVFSGEFGSDTIIDLSPHDRIDLTAFQDITDVNQLTITEENGNTIITVPDGGTITVEGLGIAEVLSQIDVACVMRGTLVRTPAGEIPVETLAVGDTVLTVDGTAERIKWIGRRTYARPFLRHKGKIAPIMFAPGSIGPDQPERPLYVSPEHAMYVNNVLIPAKLLENGTTIRQVGDFDEVEYFHLEFDKPQVILTNSAPTESYVESGNRRMFANYREYVAMYGEVKEAERRERRFYMVHGGAALQAIRRRLAGDVDVAA